MIKSFVLSVSLILCGYGHLYSQVSDYSNLTLEDYSALTLPPLDTLLQYAKLNPDVRAYEAESEYEAYELKNQRRDWLSFISFRTSYAYGVAGDYSSFSDSNYPTTKTYSEQAQTLYLIGGYVVVPFDKLFNRRTEVRKQQAKLEQAQQIHLSHLSAVQQDIISTYYGAVSALNIVKIKIEEVGFNKAQNKVVENDFVNGHIQSDALVIPRQNLYRALSELEASKAQLNTLLLQLELLTQTQFIKPKK